MQLLTLDDQTFLMDRVPDKVDEDMRFAYLVILIVAISK